MQQLRKMAEEMLALVDRYEKVENSGEAALAEMCLDAEALHFAADWMNGSDPPCVWGECPHGRTDCSRTSEESGECFIDLWRKQAMEANLDE